MIVPFVIGFAGLGTVAVVKAIRDKRGVLTPERETVFNSAMKSLAEPEKLRKLAEAFEKVGLKAQGAMLRKRAALREAPKEVLAARQAVIQTALMSTNKDAVTDVIKAAEEIGMTGNAQKLREYQLGLIDTND